MLDRASYVITIATEPSFLNMTQFVEYFQYVKNTLFT